ncbi:MAG: hypothetical protein A2283_13160 [Lentisphaerae bacterium RIFOXYA12_FULL_48_11]|nr:MAG: hypothetical protein A2283_13160 [Lentisphaerae bacterium RIFOXYA12_FULL_48_11]
MIISVSRRTDIPAFYAEWFINRVRAGYCTVPNPFNDKQVSRIPLSPANVDVIVFWTRNPAPLMKYLPELDERGFRYYFLYTVMDNPRLLDPKVPPVAESIRIFTELSDQIGAEKVIWRYDPMVLSTHTGIDFHIEKFSTIASGLKGRTQRVIISLVDVYKSIMSRMDELGESGLKLLVPDAVILEKLICPLVEIADENGMEIVSCAEKFDLEPFGVKPAKCIDDVLIHRVFGLSVSGGKDPAQRKACGCVVSRDIGMYDTCAFNCVYCYATRSFDAVKKNRARHDVASPSLSGWYE